MNVLLLLSCIFHYDCTCIVFLPEHLLLYQVEFSVAMSWISVVDEDMVEDDDSDREEEEGHPFHQGMPPGFPPGFGGLGGLGGLPMMPGMHLGGGMTLWKFAGGANM